MNSNNMGVQAIYWVTLLVLLEGATVTSWSNKCDHSFVNNTLLEGNVGETKTFPWLGVLIVHLHHEASLQIALTGIVLVKEEYAIANADDIAKIPKRVFKIDSKAMFIPSDKKPWYSKLLDYMIHPEYERHTLNTIALVELVPAEKFYPMKPICWYSHAHQPTKLLYAMGYTDEHDLLEKCIYQMKYVEQSVCTEFYTRAGLTGNQKMVPTHYRCGVELDSEETCVWDNGMALVSKSSGYWTLVGLGLQGPGCAAPARFIDLLHYYPWIESASNLQKNKDLRRKSAFDEGFRGTKNTKDMEYIPLHDLRTDLNKEIYISDKIYDEKQKFAHYYASNNLDDQFAIERVDNTEIIILNNQVGECSSETNKKVYTDSIKLVATMDSSYKGQTIRYKKAGVVNYKISMYDLFFSNYTCVKIKLVPKQQENAYIYYGTEMETGSHDDAQEIIKHYPIVKPLEEKKVLMRPVSIKDTSRRIVAPNLNIVLQFMFEHECTVKIDVFGTYKTDSTTPQAPTITTTNAAVKPNDPEVDNDNDAAQDEKPIEEITMKVNLGMRTTTGLNSFILTVLFLR